MTKACDSSDAYKKSQLLTHPPLCSPRFLCKAFQHSLKRFLMQNGKTTKAAEHSPSKNSLGESKPSAVQLVARCQRKPRYNFSMRVLSPTYTLAAGDRSRSHAHLSLSSIFRWSFSLLHGSRLACHRSFTPSTRLQSRPAETVCSLGG